MICPELTTGQKKTFRSRLLEWYRHNSRTFKWRITLDSYSILIAELLLRRTNAKAAHSVYPLFMSKYPTPKKLGAADTIELLELVKPLGLKWRADNLVSLAAHFTKDCSMPNSFESLSALPGVGPYVARAVLVNSRELPVMPVDSNIVRVLCRYFGIEARDSLRKNKRFQQFADSLVDEATVRDLNFALLDFAASICRAQQPQCKTCPLAKDCKSVDQFTS